ncbi:outer membrane protein assembly factor BamB family protein [Nonomuraea gerenzanensis]|uniref:Putative serine/threonine protein kinase n=1 Tax=Nonomuraea gerenzanensis TaxID=93944 RepID=A0A1M4EHD7_9ACTN|nr:PQQ-binding-like beta-propeller repeat protein [Nonomuraea gerenzanensis]UBU09925.1 PQQ-binding-like beta-propeller repeat protein [Nonomuraea gerenzanensis]SBO98377.1 putative serine/threonine protein kinase [Nonomuraea gerenzanensis]
MRLIHFLSCALASVLLLGLIGLPGEIITSAGGAAQPWRPAGRGTPPIDVVGRVSAASTVVGDVAVAGRWELTGDSLSGERIGDGATVWTYRNAWGDDLVGHPALDDRRLAAVWRDGRVTSIDVTDGRVVWQTDIPPGPGHEANRAYDEEWGAAWEITVARHGSVPVLVILHEGRLDVLDGRTGAIRWSYPPASTGTCQAPGSARGVGEVVLVFGNCANPGPQPEVALSAADGRPLWRFDGGELWHARDLGDGRLASVDEKGRLNVRAAGDGKIVWQTTLPRRDDSPAGEEMGVAAGLLTVRTRTEVSAYRIADGGLAWRRAMKDAWSDTVLTDGTHTYVAEDAGTLLKLDARTGHLVDRHRFESDISPSWMRDGLAGISVLHGDDVVVG